MRSGLQRPLSWGVAAVLASCALGSLALEIAGIRGTGATTPLFARFPFIDMWIRWDAGWYQGIATEGYYFSTSHQSSAAYFPLYPLAIRALVRMGANPFLAGMALTVVCGLIAVCLFWLWAQGLSGLAAAKGATRLLLLWPFAFFLYGAVYSDALYVALAVGAFLCLERRAIWAATFLGALATATRPVAPALVLGLVLRNIELAKREERRLLPRDFAPALSILGLVAFMVFLGERFGDPLAFVKAQSGWHQEPGLATLFKLPFFERVMAARSYGDFGLPLLHAALAVAFLGLAVPTRRLLGNSYAAYIALVIGMPLLSSRNFIGLGRYCLAAFPCFLTLSMMLKDHPRAARAWTVVSAVLLAVMVSQFAIGRYVS